MHDRNFLNFFGSFLPALTVIFIPALTSQVNSLPTIDLESTFEVNHDALRDVAFMRVVGKKYRNKLSDIYVPCDLSEYSGKYTVEDAKEAIPEIKDKLIERYEKEIEKKLNIL